MLKRISYGVASLVMLAASLFFVYIIGHLGRTIIWPALRAGSLDVATNARILNILWEGNEIYIVLCAYLLLAVAFAYGAWRCFRRAFSRT